MKLLLTSLGITNKSIEKKFLKMVNKKPSEIRLAYVPTAAYMTSDPNKWWVIDNLHQLKKMGIGVIDIVDFTALPKKVWRGRLEQSDVIFVEGGKVPYLLKKGKESGFTEELPKLLKNKLYVGASAGATMLGKITISTSKEKPFYKKFNGLTFYNFSIRPHFYRPDRPQFTEKTTQKLSNKFNSIFYAIDDNTAISVEDGKVEVISEGKWMKFEPRS